MENSLLKKYPKIAAEWHPTKNGDLKPSAVTVRSNKKVWWYLHYYDSNTGKYYDFEWEAKICNRTKKKDKCPYLTGRAVWKGYNDLASVYPEIAAEWHPLKNGKLKPTEVTAGSGKKVWWYLPYDDIDTGKHYDFEWEAKICDRTNQKDKCPYLTGRAVWKGYNDLASVYPEIAAEWHPIKNGDLKPSDVTAGSNKKVWWYLPYDDPVTGKHFDFEWDDTVNHRMAGRHCPFLSGRRIWVGYNDLMSTHPELCKEWNYEKNLLTPFEVSKGYTKKVWWIYPYEDPETGKHFDFEWEETINNRVRGKYGCPYLSGQRVWKGYNDLATTHPEIAKYWDKDKNSLTPEEVSVGFNKKVHWKYPYDDPCTGKHFDFEWMARIANLKRGHICPYVSNHLIWEGYNDLATLHPELLEEWDYEKNGSLLPTQIGAGYSKKVWWKYPYDDPKTGKHFIFVWKTKISDRLKGHGCPFLSGQAVWEGYNDLATTHPNIAKYWNYEENHLLPSEVSKGYIKKVWWKYPYDDPKTGKHFDFVWDISPNAMISKSNDIVCPFLTNQRIWQGFNDFPTFFPELLEEWNYEKNKKIKPHYYAVSSEKKVWWRCKQCGYEWRTSICNRTQGKGCSNYLNHTT